MATQHANAVPHVQSVPQSNPDRIQVVLEQLTEKSHLHRTRAHSLLSSQLPNWNATEIAELESSLIPLLDGSHEWETVFGAVTAAETCLPFATSDSFREVLVAATTRLITHPEPRVRQAVASLIGALATRCGGNVWRSLAPELLSHVDSNFILDDSVRLQEASAVAARELDPAAASAKSASAMLHETEGWRSLETMLLATGRLTEGCGEAVMLSAGDGNAMIVIPELQQILEYIRRASAHPNRFVREAGLKLLTAVAGAAATLRVKHKKQTAVLPEVSQFSVATIRDGLQDNWSQVRFAASVAARTVLKGLSENERECLYVDLLPRMCLNRHYVAEGVRNYSQETWRTVIGGTGRRFLQDNVAIFVEFYEAQCKADNHAVREAACQGLSEVALRLERGSVKGIAGRIASGLIDGFKDESWPVRDHACRSLAHVVSAFASEVEETGKLEEMFGLFSAHVCDNIPSVRANCAEAFVKCGLAYGDTHEIFGVAMIGKVARGLLQKIESQKERDESDAEKKTKTKDSQYGASTKLAGDIEHTDQVMYSCGSLAPRLRRGGGCTDHGFVRPREGWEEADGGLHLWARLMDSERGRDIGFEMIGEVVSAGVCGAKKKFGGRGRFLGSVLKAVSGARLDWKKVDKRTTVDMIEVTEYGNKEGGSVKRDALECVRNMRSSMGVIVFSRLLK